MGDVQLMHAGEEALFVIVPLAIVFLLDYRKRRKDRRAAEQAWETGGADIQDKPAERRAEHREQP